MIPLLTAIGAVTILAILALTLHKIWLDTRPGVPEEVGPDDTTEPIEVQLGEG